MQCRNFEITLISATDLEPVRTVFKMKVHARATIGGLHETEKRTPADKHGDAYPAWNYTLRYNINETMIQNYNTMLVIKLYCTRKLGDRYVGEVHACMKELFDCVYASGGCSGIVTFPVKKGCVNSQGFLRFSYKFGERVNIDRLLLAESIATWSHC